MTEIGTPAVSPWRIDTGVVCARCGAEEVTELGRCLACWRRGVPSSLGVSRRYAACSLENWRGAVPKPLQDWLENPTEILVLTGPTGSGKTHLATACLVQLVKQRRCSGIWRDVPALGDELRCEEFGDGGRPFLFRLARAKLAVFDDWGHERITDYTQERFETIIRSRFDSCLGTLITTNLEPPAAGSRDDNPSFNRRLFSKPPIRMAAGTAGPHRLVACQGG